MRTCSPIASLIKQRTAANLEQPWGKHQIPNTKLQRMTKRQIPVTRARQVGFKKKRNCSSRRKEAHFEESQWNRASLRRLLRILESALHVRTSRAVAFPVRNNVSSPDTVEKPWFEKSPPLRTSGPGGKVPPSS